MKTLEEFRADNLRLLERLCPEDREYIKRWMDQFDEQHGMKARSKPRSKRAVGSRTRAASRAMIR
ncbi:MAG TPA: hypothetical protein VGH70_05970 [Bradyrhizobium sp.]